MTDNSHNHDSLITALDSLLDRERAALLEGALGTGAYLLWREDERLLSGVVGGLAVTTWLSSIGRRCNWGAVSFRDGRGSGIAAKQKHARTQTRNTNTQ